MKGCKEKEEKGKRYHRVEQSFGSFRRVIPLEDDVDAEQVKGEYREGVLRVSIPKSETAVAKKIPIKN